MVKAPIMHVRVFRNGALVTRCGRATPGENEVTGLPLLFSSDTLRISATSGRVADLRETCHLAHTPAAPTGPNPATEAELLALRGQLADLEDDAKSLRTRGVLFERLAAAAPHEPPSTLPPIHRLLAMHAAAGARLDATDERLLKLATQRETLQRSIQALANTPVIDTQPPRFMRGVRFNLRADAPSDFELSYFVSAARWQPTYGLDLNTQDEPEAALRLSAMVAQATGEDWRGVEMSFSTADLARETTAPIVSAWRLSQAQPERPPAFRPPPPGLKGLFSAYDAERPPTPPAPSVPVQSAQGGGGPTFGASDEWAEGAHASALAEVEMDMFDDEVSCSEPEPVATAAPMMERSRRLAPPRPSRLAMKSKKASMPPALGASGASGAGGPPGASGPPDAPADPKLRYAYLHLAGPDEPERGTLRPVDPRRHLWMLLQDHQVSTPEDLNRAVAALESAHGRLQNLPRPHSAAHEMGPAFPYAHLAAGQHDVADDGGWRRVAVRTFEAPATRRWQAVPRHDTQVFRFAAVRTEAGIPLPSGSMAFYLDGVAAGHSALTGGGGGAPVDLNLGVEPAIRVTDRTVKTQQKDHGLIHSTTRVTHQVEVTVRSALPVPTVVRLFDRLPVPADGIEDVSVRLDQSTPEATRDDRGAQDEHLSGGLHWDLEIPAGGASTLRYTWSLELPTKAELEGGNRRD